ncbi:hypothetical protein [Parendozoicomonas sp. Alg238-R29]|uniref:hypothetical protein n=1 Tax=Parendozoicomonas sp. Alg238-R29 TaxID=2993446 RepID=UPI00248DDB49|nr:hypothetical protein [Parendozoicomonas sp. Alg238-R29]
MASPLSTKGVADSGGSNRNHDWVQRTKSKQHEAGAVRIAGQHLPRVAEKGGAFATPDTALPNRRVREEKETIIPLSSLSLEEQQLFSLGEAPSVDQEKSLLVKLCRNMAGNSSSSEEKEQFSRLGSMFDQLFFFKVPDELPDFRLIRCYLGFGAEGWTYTTAPFNPKDQSQLKKVQNKAQLAGLFVKYICSSQFFTPVNKSIGTYIRKWLRTKNFCQILEIGAGTGWWASALAHRGNTQKNISAVSVKATDSKEALISMVKDMVEREEIVPQAQSEQRIPEEVPQDKEQCAFTRPVTTVEGQISEELGKGYISIATAHHVEMSDAVESIKRYSCDHDILLVTSPVPEVVNALQHWPRDKPIFWVSQVTLNQYARDNGHKVTYQKLSNDLDTLVLTMPASGRSCVIEVIKINSWV